MTDGVNLYFIFSAVFCSWNKSWRASPELSNKLKILLVQLNYLFCFFRYLKPVRLFVFLMCMRLAQFIKKCSKRLKILNTITLPNRTCYVRLLGDFVGVVYVIISDAVTKLWYSNGVPLCICLSDSSFFCCQPFYCNWRSI